MFVAGQLQSHALPLSYRSLLVWWLLNILFCTTMCDPLLAYETVQYFTAFQWLRTSYSDLQREINGPCRNNMYSLKCYIKAGKDSSTWFTLKHICMSKEQLQPDFEIVVTGKMESTYFTLETKQRPKTKRTTTEIRQWSSTWLLFCRLPAHRRESRRDFEFSST